MRGDFRPLRGAPREKYIWQTGLLVLFAHLSPKGPPLLQKRGGFIIASAVAVGWPAGVVCVTCAMMATSPEPLEVTFR